MANLAQKHRNKVQTRGHHPANVAGFTLVELMIAVVIIGIVAAIAIPNYSRLNESMKFEDAYNSTRSAFNRCRGEAVSMESAKDMSAGVTMPVSLVLFPNGFACIVWYDASSDAVLGGGSNDFGSDGMPDGGEAGGEIQRILFQTRFDSTVAINDVPVGTRVDGAGSFLGTAAQNASTGWLLSILPGGYYVASTGASITARIVMSPKDGPSSAFNVFPSGQVVGH